MLEQVPHPCNSRPSPDWKHNFSTFLHLLWLWECRSTHVKILCRESVFFYWLFFGFVCLWFFCSFTMICLAMDFLLFILWGIYWFLESVIGSHLLVMEKLAAIIFATVLSSPSHSFLFRAVITGILNFTLDALCLFLSLCIFIFYLSMVIFGYPSKLPLSSLIHS